MRKLSAWNPLEIYDGGTILSILVKANELEVRLNVDTAVSKLNIIVASQGNHTLGIIVGNITYKREGWIELLYKTIVRHLCSTIMQARKRYRRDV